MQNWETRSPVKKKMTLGDILLAERVLTLEQLAEMLILQKHQHPFKPLGKLCVEMGYISQDDLNRLIKSYKKRIVLGDLFINLGIATPTQVTEALSRQRESGKRLGQTLIDMCVITDEDLALALSRQLDIPLVKPQVKQIDKELVLSVKESFLRANLCLPLDMHEDAIIVAMADPLRGDLVKDLSLLLGAKVEVAIASRYDITNALAQIFGPAKAKEMPLEEAEPSGLSIFGFKLRRQTLTLFLATGFLFFIAIFALRWYQDQGPARRSAQAPPPAGQAIVKKVEAPPEVPSVQKKGEVKPTPPPTKPLPLAQVAPKERAAVAPPVVPKPELKPPAPPRVAAKPEEPGVARFTVQVSAHQDEEQARKVVNQLKAKDLDAFITVADLKDKGRWYRVKVGRFADSAAAKRAADEVSKSLAQKVLVTPL